MGKGQEAFLGADSVKALRPLILYDHSYQSMPVQIIITSIMMQTSNSKQSRTLQPNATLSQPIDQMEKTGIESIDKFFNYGEKTSGLNRVPFVPLIGAVIDMFESEYTESLHDRKANSIVKFTQERDNGFFYE